MRSATQEKLLSILLKAIKPLVHLLLESGIGHREFSEIAKRAFVEVATKEYGIRGRDTNISRVAVMTGLTRKEVKKIREGLGEGGFDTKEPVRPIPACTVLARWFADSEFKDESGNPRVLHFLDGDFSFADLVKKYAGDIPPGALRTELVRAGAVVELPNGYLQAIRREFKVVDNKQKIFRGVERLVAGTVSNLANNNIESARSSRGWYTWPEYLVEINNVHPSKLEGASKLVKQRLKACAEQIDDELKNLDRFEADSIAEPRGKTIVIGMNYSERVPGMADQSSPG